jgi:hypothetical protein
MVHGAVGAGAAAQVFSVSLLSFLFFKGEEEQEEEEQQEEEQQQEEEHVLLSTWLRSSTKLQQQQQTIREDNFHGRKKTNHKFKDLSCDLTNAYDQIIGTVI